MRLVYLLICLCVGLGCAIADDSISARSVGAAIGAEGAMLTYIHDGRDYGLAFGKELGKSDRWTTSAWIVFQPEDGRQIATALSVGYEVRASEIVEGVAGLIGLGIRARALDKLTVTPLAGVLTDVTAGYNGHETRVFWGMSAKIRF